MAAKKSHPKRKVGLQIEAPFVAHTRPFSNLELVDTTIRYGSLSGGSKPDSIRKITNVSFTNTRVSHSSARNLALKNVVVTGCETETPVRLVNCFFDGVVMTGDLGRWHVSLDLFMPSLRTYAGAFYSDVDWALDIREARFHDAILRGIPVDKVRRDPERHFVLRKAKLRTDDSWKRMPKPIVNRIRFWLWLDGESELLVANDHAPSFERELDGYRTLRDAGFVE